ncbi:MAG: FAD-dependent oxidoreductase [Deltaproteobacteria bacterium]|nr:FAD-dependent oxidoreductase [Deltaproteobacteria bacterium]
MSQRLIVVGGVAAGLSAASSAKRLRPDLEVIVLERGRHISYGACSIPYYIADLIKEPETLVVIPPERFEKERDIRIRIFHEAAHVDTNKKVVAGVNHEKSGSFELAYDFLVIATGAAPLIPTIPGVDLKGIFTLRTLEDGIDIKRAISDRSPSKCVIIGGGYIGLELAEAFRARGMEVVVVEKLDHILGTMDDEINEVVERELAEQGVLLYKETTVEAFRGENGRVREVVTDRGTLEADMVLLSAGIRPENALARQIGLELGPAGAVSVDESMRTSREGIFAAGDCADVFHRIKGSKAYIPLGTTANKQGRVAGEVIGGLASTFEGVVGTAVSKVFRLGVARTGLTEREAAQIGADSFCTVIQSSTRAHSYPGAGRITVKITVERGSGRLLGAQIVGTEGVAKRIDIMAAALHAGMTIHDVAALDLSYAPPFAPVWDPILIAANVAKKQA